MLCPFAEWRPVVNHRAGGMLRPMRGIVLHHSVGTMDDAEALFNRPSSQASAHFGIAYDGSIRQWVDTGDAAFHACQANWTGWVGIENESPTSGDLFPPLTDAQVAANARVLAWLNQTEGIAVAVSDDPGVGGVAYHSMNPGDCASHWGITGCPGDAIIGQRARIVTEASGAAPPVSPTAQEDSMLIRRSENGPEGSNQPAGHTELLDGFGGAWWEPAYDALPNIVAVSNVVWDQVHGAATTRGQQLTSAAGSTGQGGGPSDAQKAAVDKAVAVLSANGSAEAEAARELATAFG